MYYSKMLIPTLKETPAEAEIISHKLMLRSGLIRRLAAGIYCLLPLGYRIIRKIEGIIREEMNKSGAQEVMLPFLSPADLWRQSGRWKLYGAELLRLKDRHQREFCLAPTHEEVITNLVQHEVHSYRQLPLNLYQLGTKFRDEIRPRFGLMRGREFIMKDGYSFDRDEAGAERTYQEMYEAYCRIFSRCGIRFRAVEADTGTIGGSFSHEFMVLAANGEEAIVSCSGCTYAANIERAEAKQLPPTAIPAKLKLSEAVATPGVRTVAEVTAYLDCSPQQLVKTLILLADGKPVAVLLRGDHELNEVKLRNRLGCQQLFFADGETILHLTGAGKGFSGPVGLKGIKVIADQAVAGIYNFVTGANRDDTHLVGVNQDRDFAVDQFADIRKVVPGDLCPRCGKALNFSRGIEVAHIFKLGTKYSQALGATYRDEQSNEIPIVMGCYGIGVGRTAAAAIEQNHDENGIIWPLAIAPFRVLILPLEVDNSELWSVATSIYEMLTEKGIEVLLDDRPDRPGVKFKDADLLGIPFRITIGPRGLKDNYLELKRRGQQEVIRMPLSELKERILPLVS